MARVTTALNKVLQASAGVQDWEDVQEFYGCGKFTSDSWRIFCRNEFSLQVCMPTLALHIAATDQAYRYLDVVTALLEPALLTCYSVWRM